MNYIKTLNSIGLRDLALVGGKNANLGEMINELADKGIPIPDGFAVTAQAYTLYLESNSLYDPIAQQLTRISNLADIEQLQTVGKAIRDLILRAAIPESLEKEIIKSYQELSAKYGVENVCVAVRSSATAEDLPNASFAGQQESFLNITCPQVLLKAYKECLASLFTDRAIVYRVEKGFDHFKVKLSVGVQKMVRSDLACAGVIFTLDTESGFKDVVTINAAYGLGESIVKGRVIPDEFYVHKPTFKLGYRSIIKKELGSKETKLIIDGGVIKEVVVPGYEQQKFSITDDEIAQLTHMALTIEKYYSERNGLWTPMDIEWAKDGIDGKLYITQARPETVHVKNAGAASVKLYQLKNISDKERAERLLLQGQSIGKKIATGRVRIVKSPAELRTFNEGDVLVAQMTDPDWVSVMKKAAAIITDRGGRTCHAAIVSRELGIPAVVGTFAATQTLKNGQQITVDCSQGMIGEIYDGALEIATTNITYDALPKAPVEILLNIADPSRAFELSALPVAGVGLARLEFIIAHRVKIHPMALIQPEKVTDHTVTKKIDELTVGYAHKEDYYIDTLAQGIGMIAAAFYPRQVCVRLSDLKSNEYRNLLGGSFFEPIEENPMIGLRGACRAYHPQFEKAFELECKSFFKIREIFGLKNVKIIVPFVRTVQEAQKVLGKMTCQSLERGKDGLQIIMMCEIPSNVILIEEFSQMFDGFSIGSNDLAQLTLGVDRDSALLAGLFDERDPAVMKLFEIALEAARKKKKYMSICGQAPSDYPEVAKKLIEKGIDSISLNADAVIPFLLGQK